LLNTFLSLLQKHFRPNNSLRRGCTGNLGSKAKSWAEKWLLGLLAQKKEGKQILTEARIHVLRAQHEEAAHETWKSLGMEANRFGNNN
jgi:hypothetical protein